MTNRIAQARVPHLHVRYWHKADVQTALMNVRFEGNNGHDADVTRCLLMTQSGHHLGLNVTPQ
jgi:hypothetical protein